MSSTLAASLTQPSQGDHQSQLQLAALGLSSIGRSVSTPSSQTTQTERDGPFLATLRDRQQMMHMAALHEQHQQHLQMYAIHQLARGAPSPQDATKATNAQHDAYVSHFIEKQARAQKVMISQHSQANPMASPSEVSAEVPSDILGPPDVPQPGMAQIPWTHELDVAIPQSGMAQIQWNNELDAALRQLDAEHSGDWKRIGLRMNLPAEECRRRLEALMSCDEGNLTVEERAALVAARERRIRREAEIRSKVEKSKFFRQLRQDRKKGEDDNSSQLEEEKRTHNTKRMSSPTNSVTSSAEQERSDCSSLSGGESTKGSKRNISFKDSPDSPSGKKSKVEEEVEAEMGKVPDKGSLSPTVKKDSKSVESVERCKIDETKSLLRQTTEMRQKGAKPNLEPVTCPSSMPESAGGEDGEFGEEGFAVGTFESPLSVDELRPCETPGSQKVRYQEGFFFRVTKIFPGKKKDSLGFLALPKDISFAKARVRISYELDLDDSWAFFLPSLGPVSRRQESSLGAMASWLTVKHKELAGSRRNPIDIIIVNRR